MRLGRSFLAGDRRYPALESILRREPFDRTVQTSELDEMKELVLSLDERHLVIQGPPGSGKTWTSGRLIAHLIDARQARRRRLDEPQGDPQSARRGRGRGRRARARLPRAEEGKRRQPRVPLRRARTSRASTVGRAAPTATSPPARPGSSPTRPRQHARLPLHRRGRAGLARRRARDGHGGAERRPRRRSAAARQVIQGTHPFGSGASVLRHLLGDDATVPPDRGLFLERTYRLHPDVCGYISEEFYEGRLEPAPVAAGRTTPLGTGLRYLAVEHEGHRQESPEEVAIVRAEVERLRARGHHGRDRRRRAFNAQVNALAGGAARASASAPWTSSRGRRRTSSSTRWRARVGRTSRAGSSSCSRATG